MNCEVHMSKEGKCSGTKGWIPCRVCESKESQGEIGCSMEQSLSPALRHFFWCE